MVSRSHTRAATKTKSTLAIIIFNVKSRAYCALFFSVFFCTGGKKKKKTKNLPAFEQKKKKFRPNLHRTGERLKCNCSRFLRQTAGHNNTNNPPTRTAINIIEMIAVGGFIHCTGITKVCREKHSLLPHANYYIRGLQTLIITQ